MKKYITVLLALAVTSTVVAELQIHQPRATSPLQNMLQGLQMIAGIQERNAQLRMQQQMQEYQEQRTRRQEFQAAAARLGDIENPGESEEGTLKRVQQAKYNFVSGVWQIRMNEEIRDIEKGFKTYLPRLDYTLVDEKIKDSDRMTMTFRGMGDKKLVVKVKSQGIFTILSIRLGLTGNENKSAQIFSFVYRRM